VKPVFRAALALVLTVVTAGLAPARAEITLDFTESFAFDWHWVLDDPQILDEADRENVLDLRNRFNARLKTGDWTFGLRLDMAWFPSPPTSQYGSDLRPEEVFVTWRSGEWTLTAGDDYLTLGRGLALSLRKFDEVGFATGLRGVHAGFRTDGFRMRLGVGTTNTVNVDSVEEKLVPDPNDLVFMARLETDAIEKVRLGVHVVDIERRHSGLRNAVTQLYGDDDDDRLQGRRFERTLIAGASVEATQLADALDLFAEVGWLTNDETRQTLQGDVDAGQDGLALYGSASATLGRWTALLEGKHYDRWRIESTHHPDTATEQGITQVFPYIAPPSLERIDQRVINTTDVSGVRLKVDYSFERNSRGDRNVVFVNNAFFVDAPAQGEWTWHGYLGWERTTERGERLLLQAGHRREEAPDAIDGGLIRLSMVHLDLDWSKTVAPGVDLVAHWSHEFRSKNLGADALADSYTEGTFYLGVNLPPAWSFTAQFEYLTEDNSEHQSFPGAFVQYRPDPGSLVRLFVGRSKGGLKCSGGVCRIFPDFEGVKLETTLRF
jgi:hypothetical protein